MAGYGKAQDSKMAHIQQKFYSLSCHGFAYERPVLTGDAAGEGWMASRDARMPLARDVLRTRPPPTSDQLEGRSCVANMTQTGFKIGSIIAISVESHAV